MSKIGILTLNGYYNYGNRLQNFALQEKIKGLDYECETILNDTFEVEHEGNKIINFVKKTNREKFATVKIRIDNFVKKYNKSNKILEKNREEIFREFTSKNIKETKFIINKKNILKDELKDYDFFVSGSDQVWNPTYPTVSEINFMTFANVEKRVAYAPSFGVSDIEEKYKERYKKWLKDIKYISIREEAGANIIKELTGKVAPVLIDPTMLLEKEEWLKVSKPDINKPKKKYLLTYFLGGIPKEYKKYIQKVAKNNELEIVDLANIKIPKYYVNGPSEFIDYINSAELFMTDSFHGCVFSMLMETPFIVCKRKGQTIKEDMYSRIDTFVSKFKLEDRQFEDIKDKNLFKIDYTESYKILEKEREKSYVFLASALNTNYNLKNI